MRSLSHILIIIKLIYECYGSLLDLLHPKPDYSIMPVPIDGNIRIMEIDE